MRVFITALFIFSTAAAHAAMNKDSLPFENSRFTEINGINIHYRTWAPENQKPSQKILLVHGFGASTYSWRENVEALQKKGFLVVTADVPPFGYSEKKTDFDYSTKNISNLLFQLLDSIDKDHAAADAKWSLAGHSMGGGIITAMAQEKPEKINSLLLINGVLNIHNHPVLSLALKIQPLEKLTKMAARKIFINKRNISRILEQSYDRKPTEEEVFSYLKPLQNKVVLDAIVEMYMNPGRNYDYDLSSIKVPVLVIAGMNDKWISYEAASFLKRSMPNVETFVFFNEAHCPMETNPVAFNALMVDFFQSPGKADLFVSE